MRRLVLSLCLLAAWAASARAGSLRAEGGWFKDPAGGVVLLRGVNAAGNSKVPPFTAMDRAELFDPLADWGLNVVRLLFNWEAFEPAPGVYDEAYLDYYEQAVDWAAERGIHVMVDVHQDAFARNQMRGCGEGFPFWAASPELPTYAPVNDETCKLWGLQIILDPNVHDQFRRFYANEGGVRDRYLAMLDKVAERLASKPMVAGYDPLNEPWSNDEAAELLPLYEDATAVVRARDPSAILFLCPRTVTSAGAWSYLPKPSFDNVAYAPHFYDPLVAVFGAWLGNPADRAFAGMAAKAAEWGGVPWLLGEFGGQGPGRNIRGYVDHLYAQLNARFASGTQWVYTPGWTEEAKDGWNVEDFSIVDGDGNPRPNFRVRPFPRRTAGTPGKLFVRDPEGSRTAAFDYRWEHDPAAGATEVFLPKALFGAFPPLVKTEGDALSCAYDGAGVVMTCASPSPGPKRLRARACVPAWGECG